MWFRHTLIAVVFNPIVTSMYLAINHLIFSKYLWNIKHQSTYV